MTQLHPKLDLTHVEWTKLEDVKRAADDQFVLLIAGADKMPLKDLIEQNDTYTFNFKENDAGNSYFEWKTTLKDMKQNVDVVVYDSENNYVYTGNGIRRLLSLPDRGGAFWNSKERKDIQNFSPIDVSGRKKFPIFISSTSISRRVKAGDRVLYRKTDLL
jgi:hypothetical protein